MSIASVNSYQSIYKPSDTHHFRKISEEFTDLVTAKPDTVNLSKESKRLAQSSVSSPPPMEVYALPDWFVSMLPKESLIKHEGSLQEMKPRSTYYGGNKKAIGCCFDTALKYLREESEKTGISQVERYYMKISQPDQYAEYDEKLHQAVRNRLLADDQYVKYSKVLGITF